MSPPGRRVRLVAIGLLVLTALLAWLGASFIPEQLAIRRAIQDIRGGGPAAAKALGELEGRSARALRPQLGWLLAGLDVWAVELRAKAAVGARGSGSGDRADPSAEARRVSAVLARIARSSPRAVADALEQPSLGPIAYRALLKAGHAALACPLPRERTLSPWRRAVTQIDAASLSFEWGEAEPALTWNEYDVVFTLRYDYSLCVALWPGGAGAIADLGDVPPEGARPPPPGDPRWLRLSTSAVSATPPAAAAGHTYVVQVDRPRVALTAALRIEELEPYTHVRVRWRVLSCERIAD